MRESSYQSGNRIYNNIVRLSDGEICDIYLAQTKVGDEEKPVLIKLAGELHLNEYVRREIEVLRYVNKELKNASRANKLTVPELIDEFRYGDREAAVTDYAAGYFTLEEIKQVYPQGIAPEHVAWIFNRILASLMAAHSVGVVHGKVLPCHMLIYSGTRDDDMRHTGVLVDWTCAVREEGPNQWPKIPAMSEEYADYYPYEVKVRQSASPVTDLAMAAACAQYLLGGNVATGEVPDSTPWGMAQLLRTCREKNPAQRPRSLPEFYNQFKQVLFQIFGKPRFVELPLPSRPIVVSK